MSPVVDTEHFDPRDEAFIQCPYPHYAALRAEGGVHEIDGESVGRRGQRVFAVSRHDLAIEVLADWRTWSSRVGSPSAVPPPHLIEQLRAIARGGVRAASTML
ncbi:MAG TPA: hypothetical protein DCR14_15295, partial [Acidimicrobiaceae bacterium]|nr:hypothetical protein [Acidimicrobiaceae bacterium]